MYQLEKACILPKRRGIMVLQEFESDVESVYACNGLFYQNEYGIRKLNVFRFNSLEVSDIHWLSSPAHVILPSSTVSFWHFLQSLVPAFEFVMKDTMAPEQTTFYFLENNLQVKSDSCLLRQNSPIIATKLSNFKHDYSTDGIYELFTSPFESNVNVEQLETMQCHEEVIIGTPLVLHHSAHEWVQILKKKEKKIERDTLNYFGKDFFSIPVENGYQKEYSNAVKQAKGITGCSCPATQKPILLLISRKYNRRLINEREIERIAKSYFETIPVFLEKLPVLEQLKLFSCASVAVGAAGTGMTWMIFMREGASVILFQNHGRVQTELIEKGIQIGQGGIFTPTSGAYTNFAIRGKLFIQVWQPRSKVKGKWKESDIFVDINDFRSMLNSTLLHVKSQEKFSVMSCE